MIIDAPEFAVFGSPQENAVEQMRELIWPNYSEPGSRPDERVVKAALMADHHLGYSMPIGGVVAYDNAISPTGVGFDIACGNMAVKTKLEAFDLGPYAARKGLMREIQKKIAFGMGRSNPTPVDHELFDSPVWLWLEAMSPGLKKKAEQQLGTVGSGNHYVDILVDENSNVWVANHFGSRGLGHTIASGFMSLAAGVNFSERVPEGEGAVIFDTDTELGQHYIECMQLAGEYAYAGREFVIDQVLSILGTEAVEFVHNHHNYAWQEDGLWVVRKGATPLTSFPAFIGGSMGEASVIVRGIHPVDYWLQHDELDQQPAYYYGHLPPDSAMGDEAMFTTDLGNIGSAPHGAGRIMSRTKAAGKFKKVTDEQTGKRYRVRDESTAAINWTEVRSDLTERGIVVLGAGADEAPGVYKSLSEVLSYHSNIEVLETLTPIGVVMAGPDEFDPYKD